MLRKIAKPWTEVQLGFAFLSEGEQQEPTLRQPHERRVAKPRGESAHPADLEQALTLMQTRLLDAPLTEVSAQLLALLELCEATLTRALDVVAVRETSPLFSAEEQRSIRGIGQAQWLLAEKLARRNVKPEERRGKQKPMNGGQSSQ